MKRNVLLLLSLLLFVSVTIAGPLHSSVIDEATTYLDVGYQADNVYVEAVKIEVLSQEVNSNTIAYCIATQAVSVKSGINVSTNSFQEPGWVRHSHSFTKFTIKELGNVTYSPLARSPRDAL